MSLDKIGSFLCFALRHRPDQVGIELDEHGYIVADESTKTNIDGVFAAGDIRTKELRQVVTAVSDGATAAHFAEQYLAVK